MKLDIFDVDEFVELNHLKEVSSPVLFQRGGIPDPDGLVSNDIFGVNIKDRKETFAYINLNANFFHPHAYKILKRLYRNIEDIVGGSELYSISKDGELTKDPNGETGMDFLYNNWEKIQWERTNGQRNERIDLVTKIPKDEVFIRKQIVIPAFYRDVSSDEKGGGSTVEINTLYTKLIRMCTLIRDESLFDFSFNSTMLSIQNTLVDIYDYFKGKLSKKNGLIRKFLLGKNVDYSVRSVIAAPSFHAEAIEDNIVDYRHCAVPISQICSLFYPFMMAWLRNFFERNVIKRLTPVSIVDPDTLETLATSKIKSPDIQFNDKYYYGLMDKFIRNPDSRYDIITVDLENGETVKLRFVGKLIVNGVPSGLVKRPMTITDLLYIAACDVTENKHVMITRYPVLDQYGSFFNRIRVASTTTTVPMDVNGKVYKWYPNIDLSTPPENIGVMFIDTTKFSNSYLAGMDGDYDGDQVTIKSLFSLEANEEAEKIMLKKSTVLSNNGQNVRETDCECLQTLYVLTKDPKS